VEDKENDAQKHIDELGEVMCKPPAPLAMLVLKTDSICNFSEKGECCVSKDGGYNWKSCCIALKPFSLTLQYTNDAELESFEIVYSLLYTTMVIQPPTLQFPELHAIRFFTKDKKYIDIRSVDVKNDSAIRKWSEQCDLFLESRVHESRTTTKTTFLR